MTEDEVSTALETFAFDNDSATTTLTPAGAAIAVAGGQAVVWILSSAWPPPRRVISVPPAPNRTIAVRRVTEGRRSW